MGAERITLTAEKETLLIPLYSKALESARSRPILRDPMAEAILARIDYDFGALKTPRQSLVTLAMRAKRLDWYVSDYLARYDTPLVLHLGCGLDSRYLRVGRPNGAWYDLDYPDVIALRRSFYEEAPGWRMIASEVTDLRWLEAVEESGPACIIAEGLLMYLREEQVRSLFLSLQARFPGSEIAFDAYSRLTARSVANHPSLKHTGARIQWGIDDAREIEAWGVNIRVMEEWHFSESPDVSCLGPAYRLLFRVMGSLPAAKRAHRLIRIHL